MHPHDCPSRRGFLKTSLFGGLAVLGAGSMPRVLRAADGAGLAAPATVSRVALTTGGQRAANTFNALRSLGDSIATAIGNRRILIKPNNVSITNQLCATHAESLEGILEFLTSIGKIDQVVIAESAASGPTLDGFANYGYNKVAEKYGAKVMDLDAEGSQIVRVFDERDFRPHAVRMSKILMDPSTFIISAAKLKTHDRVIATLSLKNIIVGAAIKDKGFTWDRNRKPGAVNDKPILHGGGFRGINYNLFALAQQLHPHLAVIDGFDGMEGNGPVGGTAVDHRVCIASTDWLAADRVGIELMGINYANVGYLNFCAQAGLGQGDLSKLEIIGEKVANHIKTYKLNSNIDKQLIWMKPAQNA